MTLDPLAVERDLVAYYDAEDDRTDRPLDGRRVALRDAFLADLSPGAAVLEIGPGPGRDTAAIAAAGHRVTAVELSFGHAGRCRAAVPDAAVVCASVRALPFDDGCFDALWSMSTLMHVPDNAIDGAIADIGRVLRAGAVATIGVWSGPDVEEHSPMDAARARPARLFSRRSPSRWEELLGRIGDVRSSAVWEDDPADDFRYHVVTVVSG